jgi:hypothetical protein
MAAMPVMQEMAGNTGTMATTTAYIRLTAVCFLRPEKQQEVSAVSAPLGAEREFHNENGIYR